MKALRAIAIAVDWAVGLFLGVSAVVWGVWAKFDPTTMNVNLSDTSIGALAIIIAGGAVLAALNVVLLWGFMTRLCGMEYLRLESSGGSVSVSVKAVEEALRRSVLEIAEVSGVRVRVTPPTRKGKAVVVKTYVSLRGSVVYHSISRSIIGVLESTFSDIVSEAAPVKCHVYWEKIRREGGSSGQAQPAESLRPRFPVGEEPEAR